MRTFLIGAAALALGGCASTLATLNDRAIDSDHLDKSHDRNKVKALSGDRRLVYFLERPGTRPEGKDRVGQMIICAEPFAGALSARGAKSSATVTSAGGITDEVSAILQVVDGRAAAVRLFQDVSHELCKRYQDGTLDEEQYRTAFAAAVTAAFQQLKEPTPPPKLASETTQKTK